VTVSELGQVVGVRRKRLWTVWVAGLVGHGRTFEAAVANALGTDKPPS
jgi:hypothetical protein